MMSDPATLRDGFKPTGEFVVAARISGDGASAYAERTAGGRHAPRRCAQGVEQAAQRHRHRRHRPALGLHVGTDPQFFGQMLMQPFANNGELVWNAIDNLSGSSDLISIRGRATYSRPFDRVEALRRRRRRRSSAPRSRNSSSSCSRPRRTSPSCRRAQPGGGEALLSADQAREIERFQQDRSCASARSCARSRPGSTPTSRRWA